MDGIRLFLSGDVMLGRGIDQVLAAPVSPELREEYVTDAREYVALAERVAGHVPRPVPAAWPWGEALAVLDDWAPHARVVNLETAVTRSGDFAPHKPVCYRMSPDNLPALAAARPDVCVLANNHVLDFGRAGLLETLAGLESAGFTSAGAGRDLEEAQRPAAVPVGPGRRLVVHAVGSPTSGVPVTWAAGEDTPGVHLVRSLSRASADSLAARISADRRPGDVVVLSVHWGSNWGYDVPGEQVAFAHALIDAGVDLVHGHSSHHPRPVEVYRGRLVLYGCGDLVNDYEGIGGHERFHGDLRLLYLATLGPDGALRSLEMVPFVSRRLRLVAASREDSRWLAGTLDRVSAGYGTRVHLDAGELRIAGGRRGGAGPDVPRG